MKKQSIKSLAFLAMAGSLTASCDLLKDLDYKVIPDPLEVHGDSVRVRVDVTFPEKGIKKKVSAEITPYIASTPLKPLMVQGEKATGNGTVIAYKAGGTVTYTDVVPYKADMEASALSVTGKVFKGAKEKKQLDVINIADATITTPFLVNKDYRVIYEADNFKRVTEEKQFSQINYEKGKSNVRPTELKDKDIVELQKWLADAQSNPKIAIKSIEITGYASPEGEEDRNNTLSTDRSNTAKETIVSIAKNAKNDKAQTEIFKLKGSGEDYEGFKRELKASNFNEDEKNLVIRVLEMYKESAKREQEMRAMGKTFTELDKKIFPILRRSEVNVVYDLTGYSDEELKALSVSNPDALKLEELLFTATLTNDLNEKLRIYQIAAKNFPQDHRAVNNIGAVYFEQNKLAEAKTQFEKANAIKNNAIANNNLGAIAGVKGDRATAKELIGKSLSAGKDAKYNQGILDIMDGKYASAVSNFGGEDSFNKGLAQLLNGDAAAATKTVDASADKESAQGYYLKAIAAKRQNKDVEATTLIGKAAAKDASFGQKATQDREFVTPIAVEKAAAASAEKGKKKKK
jgi:outer membrane protein OmpA-like peptidoglycan-associated protein